MHMKPMMDVTGKDIMKSIFIYWEHKTMTSLSVLSHMLENIQIDIFCCHTKYVNTQ